MSFLKVVLRRIESGKTVPENRLCVNKLPRVQCHKNVNKITTNMYIVSHDPSVEEEHYGSSPSFSSSSSSNPLRSTVFTLLFLLSFC